MTPTGIAPVDVMCTGDELSLSNCSQVMILSHLCTGSAGVICAQGMVTIMIVSTQKQLSKM